MRTSATFRLLGLSFAFGGPPPLVDHLAWLFAGQETDAAPSVVFETRKSAKGDFEVWAGDDLLATRPGPAGIGDVVLWAVNRTAVDQAPGNLLLHAAAVERDGAALVLVGPSGSGKSTLAAGLLAEGWRYLTDEAVLIDSITGRVQPYPKPITLKPDSWPLLPALNPPIDQRAAPFFVGAWFVRALQGPAPPPVPVRTIVALSAMKAAAAGISSMAPGAGLMALADQCFRFSDSPLDQVATMDRVVRQASCWTLTHGPLADDVAALNDLWERPYLPPSVHPFRLPADAPAGRRPPQLAEGVQHLVYAEDSVLVSADGRTLHRLDAAATAILLAALSGASAEDVAAHLGQVGGAPQVQVLADMTDLLDRLRADQLLGPGVSS